MTAPTTPDADAARLVEALDNITHGVAMFSVDAMLLYCNRFYGELYGLPTRLLEPGASLFEIVQDCIDRGLFREATVDTYFCDKLAIWEAMSGQDDAIRTNVLNDGRVISVSKRDFSDGRWICVHEDITPIHRVNESLRRQKVRLEQIERKLGQSNQFLSAALEHMSHGIAMFDGDQVLLVANRRYGALYGLPDELIQPGTTLRQIVEHRVARGLFSGASPEAYIEQRLAKFSEAYAETQKLSDGRYISIVRRPMAAGGWVTTHEDVTLERTREDEVAYFAKHDPLTGLANRMSFTENFERALSETVRGTMTALLLLDLDKFKSINDRFGHQAGDAVLQQVACRIRQKCRETDTVARLGGDEFAIVLTCLKSHLRAEQLAQRLLTALAEPCLIDGRELIVRASIGWALAPEHGSDSTALFLKADRALYMAKRDRGTCAIYSKDADAFAISMQE